MVSDYLFRLLTVLPRNHLSRLVGVLAGVPLPRPINSGAISAFCRLTGARADEAEYALSSYRSLGGFFTRNLAPGARPIGEGFVSPVDGTLRSSGRIEGGALPMIKGQRYTVRSLLLDERFVAHFEHGSFINLYLSPPDYHHVHAPCEGRVIASTYIPGTLWPVNDWALRSIDDLFGKNERIVTYLQTERFGLLAVVMVGATNVGKMTVTYDDSILSNPWRRTRERFVSKEYAPSRAVAAGERIGTFHLGSTVILLCERGLDVEPAPGKVKFGVRLGS